MDPMESTWMLKLAALLALCVPLAAQAPSTVHYGRGCNGGLISMSLPKIGTPVDLTILNNDATKGLIAVGFAALQIRINGTALDPCFLYVDPAAIVPFTSLGGNGSATLFTIPNNPAFVGVTFFVQAVSFDSTGNAWTNGVRATVGL